MFGSNSRTHPIPRSARSSRAEAAELLAAPPLLEARDFLVRTDAVTLTHQMELTEIAAPPHGEALRGARMAELMEEVGAQGVHTDDIGNVVGSLGPSGDAALVLSAHLDTVFPEGTDVRVREDGGRLLAPGITDDGRGLAGLLALTRTVHALQLGLPLPVVLLATVGEEGEGDLRGVKHFFRKGGPGRRARGFLSLDGAGTSRIVNVGVGSTRFRAIVKGPGGHSWVDWGTPNPIHALGRFVQSLDSTPVPGSPEATLSVTRWGGGTSINAIPTEAWVDVEIRGTVDSTLAELERRAEEALEAALDDENSSRRRGTGILTAELAPMGRRPAGRTDVDQPLLRSAVAVTEALGFEPRLVASSTDANLPMSLGIPAITMGAGGEAGGAHTLEEWYRNVRGPDGLLRALATVCLVGETAQSA